VSGRYTKFHHLGIILTRHPRVEGIPTCRDVIPSSTIWALYWLVTHESKASWRVGTLYQVPPSGHYIDSSPTSRRHPDLGRDVIPSSTIWACIERDQNHASLVRFLQYTYKVLCF
jgi:hypothetical protein